MAVARLWQNPRMPPTAAAAPVSLPSMTRTQTVADTLLLHAGFVQRLARGLAGGAGDDLAQDAFAAALASPSGGLRDARAWLSTVVCNL